MPNLDGPQFEFFSRHRMPRPGSPVNYEDDTLKDEYEDVNGPRNLGRRRPMTEEWSDYILDAQEMKLLELRDTPLVRKPRKRKKYTRKRPLPNLGPDDTFGMYMEDDE